MRNRSYLGKNLSGMSIRNTIWRYYAHNFFRQLGFFSAVLVPFFTDWGGISLFQVQLLQSWFALCIFILEVPTGAVADYFGRKWSVALGGAVAAIGALVYGSMPNFWVFMLGEFLLAAGAALTSGADQALLYDSLVHAKKEGKSKEIFARAHTFTLLGVMLSAIIGSVIAMKLSLNATMFLSAIPFMIAGILGFTIKEPRVGHRVSESRRYVEILKSGLTYMYHEASLRRMAIDAVVVAAGGYFVIWLYQPILQTLDIPLYFFGIGHVILTGTEILIASNFIKLERLFGSGARFFRYTAMFIAIPFFLVAMYPSLGSVLLFIVISGGLGMTRIELMSSYMNRLIPSGERATVISSISMLRRFTLMFLNPLVGLMANWSLPMALGFVGILPLAVFFWSPVKKEVYES